MPRGQTYSAEFKANLVRRICQPGGPSAYQVAREGSGVPANAADEDFAEHGAALQGQIALRLVGSNAVADPSEP